MKKIALFSLMCCLGMINDAFSTNCVIENCSSGGNDCISAYNFTINPSGAEKAQAYICESGHCENGEILIAPNADKAFICYIPEGVINNFLNMGDDRWETYDLKWCSDEHIRRLRDRDVHSELVIREAEGKPYVKKTVVNSTSLDYHTKQDTGATLVFTNEDICLAYACEYGYVAASDAKSCIPKGSGGGDDGGNGNNQQDCPAGQMRATKDITITGMCTGRECTPIKKGECYNKLYLACMTAIDSKTEKKITWNGDRCVCTDDNKEFDYEQQKCVKEGNAGGNGTKKTCKELYGKYPERLACCEAGKATKWTGSVKDGTCSCVDKSKVWDSAKKQCVTPEQGGASELTDCFYNYDVSIKCANGNTYHEKGSERLKKSQLADFTCDDFNSRFGTDVKKWQELYGDLCKDEPVQPIVVLPGGPSDREIEQAQSVLSAFTASAKDEASVWKTAEGKFNTTRLASDITAGVVLGTVGGVVTGNIIKKNQVKKGFEALHCTVGGQKVADWGDEFSVGLQR